MGHSRGCPLLREPAGAFLAPDGACAAPWAVQAEGDGQAVNSLLAGGAVPRQRAVTAEVCQGAQQQLIAGTHEAIINKEAEVSKPPLLGPGWEELFLGQPATRSFSCLRVIAVLEMRI